MGTLRTLGIAQCPHPHRPHRPQGLHRPQVPETCPWREVAFSKHLWAASGLNNAK